MLGLFILLAIFVLIPIVMYITYDFFKNLYLINRLFFVIVLFGTIVSLYSWYKNYERETYLSYMPSAFNITNITYSYNESGFGPGGHVLTLVVYELPTKVANSIEKFGLDYLKNLPEEHQTNEEYYRHTYSDWKDFSIGNKLLTFYDSEGVTTEIDSKIIIGMNQAFMKKGNYIGYGRYGKIVVVPAEHKVFLLL